GQLPRRQRAAERNALAGRIHDAQEELPVRLRSARGLAHLDQDGVLAGVERDAETMPIQAHAVAPLLEGKNALAVDPDREVVVSGAAELDLARLRHGELGPGIGHRVVGVSEGLRGAQIDEREMPDRALRRRFTYTIELPAQFAFLAWILGLQIDLRLG